MNGSFSAYSFTANLAAMLVFGWIVAFAAKVFLTPAFAADNASMSRS
jgi:hypothetical protein